MLGVVMAILFPKFEASAQADKHLEAPDVIIEVGGVACPFCAYGIEKRLRKIESVAEISVLLEEGKVQVKLQVGKTVSRVLLTKAISDAGFDTKRIEFLNPKAQTPTRD
jgi:copper chaperone CopZ